MGGGECNNSNLGASNSVSTGAIDYDKFQASQCANVHSRSIQKADTRARETAPTY